MLSKLEGRLIFQIDNSAQLQIILLLECVRLHVETEYPLPPLYFQESLKRKKSRRRSKITNSAEPYKKLIIEYIDRMSIWNALQVSSANTNMYSCFIEPVIQN